MSEMTLFDALGKAAAYIVPDEGNRIYLWSGEPVAYLAGDVLFGFNGSHLGWFEDGVVRNLKGGKVGFLKSTCPVEAQDEPPRDIKKTRVMRGSQAGG